MLYGFDESLFMCMIVDIFMYCVDYVDLYFQVICSEVWSFEEGIVKLGSFSIDQGVGVCVVVGDCIVFVYLDDLLFEVIV